MSWEAIGAVAEMLGAAAVLFTLLYLAVQVKHGREMLGTQEKLALSQAYLARTEIGVQKNLSFVDTQLLLEADELVEEAGGDLSVLLGKHRKVMFHHLLIDMLHVDFNLYQAELDLLDTETIRGVRGYAKALMPYWEALDIPIYQRIRRHVAEDA